MKIDFNIIVMLLVVGTVQGLITAMVLFQSKQNRRANLFLGLLVLGFSLQSLDYFLFKSGIYFQHSEYYFLPIFYSLSFGPLLYLYVRTLTAAEINSAKFTWLHFIPVTLQFLFYLSISFRALDYKTYFWFNIHQPFTQKAELYTSVLSIGIYLFLSIRLLQNYQQRIENYFSDTKYLTLKWLRNLLFGLLILYVVWLTEHLIGSFRYGIMEILLPVYIYWIGWMGFQQKSTVASQFANQKDTPPAEKSQPEISPAMPLLIKQAMEENKLYLNPSLTLADLAQHVSLPPKFVSFIINSHFGKSFNSFVNEYRVDEFKNKLSAEPNKRFTILGLALDSGFNSQASFYRTFREVTGVSPKEYHKKQLNNS